MRKIAFFVTVYITLAVHLIHAMFSLHEAAEYGNVQRLEILIKDNLYINLRNLSDGNAPLHLAAYWGHQTAVAFLLNRGAIVDIQNDYGNTPLHCAVSNGYRAIAQLLLDYKADINVKNNEGKTPLQVAYNEGMVQLIKKHKFITSKIRALMGAMYPRTGEYSPVHILPVYISTDI